MINSINENIFRIGVNDSRQLLFENLWTLDKGISLNAYLIKDKYNALIDPAEFETHGNILDDVKEVIGNTDLHYLVINRFRPNYLSAIQTIINNYPNLKIVGNSTTLKIFEGYCNANVNFQLVKNKDVLNLGKYNLEFFTEPMLPWPETMITYCEEEQILFSGNLFSGFGMLANGIFADEQSNESFFIDEQRRYYAVALAKYARNAIKALKTLNALNIKYLAPAYGHVWRRNLSQVFSLYQSYANFQADSGVTVIYGSMYGNTREQALQIVKYLQDYGIEKVKIHDIVNVDASYALSDILKYKGVIIGAPTYSGHLFPPIENLIRYIEIFNFQNRLLGIFGAKTWTGGALKRLSQFAGNVSWKLVNKPYETMYSPKDIDFEKAKELAKNMAEQIIKEK